MAVEAKNYTRPTEIELANVPEELRDTPQWECWMLRDGRKIPIDVTTGKPYPPGKQNSDQMGNGTFWQACELFKSRDDLQGIGFRFKSTDPFTGVDLDDVRDPATGEIQLWAREIVAQFGTYAEASPSATGLHIIGLAKLLKALTKTEYHAGHVEMYSEGRYFTITGRKLPDAPSRVSDIQPQANEWYRKLKPSRNGDGPTASVSDEKIPKGSQDNWLTSRAGLYRAAGDGEAAVRDKLLVDYEQNCAPPHDNKKRVVEIAKGVCQRYAQGEKTARDAKPSRIVIPDHYQLTTLAALMKEEFPPQAWLLEGVLPAGGTSILASKPKVGKTNAMRCLALSVGRGSAFLELPTQKGLVIVLSFQGRRRDIQDHFKLQGATGAEEIEIHCGRAPKDPIDQLYDLADLRRPALITVDMMQHLIRAEDTNDYADVTLKLELVEDIARQTDAHIQLSHHLGKAEAADPMDTIMGSTSFRGSVDTILVMKRYVEYRTIQTEQRIGDDMPETILTWNAEQHAIFRGPNKVIVVKGTVDEKIEIVLRSRKEPMTQDEIRDAGQLNWSELTAGLKRLTDAKRVVRIGSGKRGEKFKYGLRESAPGTLEFPDKKGDF
jgi:RecA-family ATPase